MAFGRRKSNHTLAKHVILKMILLWAENEPPVTAHAHKKTFVTVGNRWIENAYAAKITGVQYQILLSLLGHFTIFC